MLVLVHRDSEREPAARCRVVVKVLGRDVAVLLLDVRLPRDTLLVDTDRVLLPGGVALDVPDRVRVVEVAPRDEAARLDAAGLVLEGKLCVV